MPKKRTPPPQTSKIATKIEKWLQKADEIASAPRRNMLAKRAAEKASPYASFNDRSLAAIIDFSLIFMLLMPILLRLSSVLYGGAINPLRGDVSHLSSGELFDLLIYSQFFYGLILDYIAHFVIFGMIFLWFWQKYSCTPGKWLMRMRIVDMESFNKPTFKQFILRYSAYLLSAIPLTLGFMWIMWDEERQGWHDIIANTTVIKVKNWKIKTNITAPKSPQNSQQEEL